MDNLLRDVRYAVRGLRNAPGFTAVAVATLALGIGVNTTIFSLVNAVLLRPLPVARPGELVDVYAHRVESSSHGTSSWLDYLEYRERAESLTGIVAYTNFFANLERAGRTELVVGEIVSDNYFDLLGVPPALGRGFVAEEFATELTHPVAVLSHPFWQTRFAASPEVIGETVRLNGTPYTIIGVAREGFGGMFPAVTSQLWIPVAMVENVEPLGNQRWTDSLGDTRMQRRGQRWLWMRGRMAEDVDPTQVQAELEGIAASLAAEYPESNEFERITVVPTSDVHFNPDLDGALAPAGAVILGVVALVLLVACANLANMMLARGSVRQREVAIRLALGAGRGRLLRQLLTESLTLALLGGLAGVAVAAWATGLLTRLQPPVPIDFGVDLGLDWRVLGYALLASAVTGVAFGLVPALRASRPDLVPALKDADSSEGPIRGLHLRDALVVTQVAVSIVLLISGVLMVRSLIAAQRVELGYDPDRIAFFSLAMEMNGYDQEQSSTFFVDAKQRLQAAAGVAAVSLVSRIPLSVNDNNFAVTIDGHQATEGDRPYRTGGAYVDESYFDALGLALVGGRVFDSGDVAENRRVAVVTQSFAQRYWPDGTAVGAEFRTTWGGSPHTIVGVVEDYRVNTPGEAPTPYLHFPFRPSVFGNFLVRTAEPAVEAAVGIEGELRALDPDLVFLDAGGMRKLADVRLFPVWAGAWLIGAFGGLALALSAVGLYGVIAYSVSRRTREIGIRVALGAETGRIVSLVMQRGVLLVGCGVLIGAVAAMLAGQALSAALFVSPFDPLSFALAALVLAAVAALANWLPARRASRVDPIIALRSE